MGVKSKTPPQDAGSPPHIVVLYCQHCVAEKADLVGAAQAASNLQTQLVLMPCSSKVEASHLLKILAEGADGVQVVGCPPTQCKRLAGNVQAEKRLEFARRHLQTIGLGAERLGMARAAGLSGPQLLALAEQRAAAVKPLGPSPMKGASKK